MSNVITGDKNLWQRQDLLGILADLGIEQIGAANKFTAKLPPGSMLMNIDVVGVTAFNSATTDTVTVDDGTTTFVAGVDVKTTGVKAATGFPKFYPAGGTINVTVAETGATATAGRAIVAIRYMQLGKGDFVQG